MKGQAHDVRWILAKNTGATEVPAFGVVEIDGVTHTESNQMVLNVKRPTGDEPSLFGINGWQPIPASGHGLISLEGPVYVTYDTANTPAAGEIWGPQTDLFTAKKGNSGLIVFGTTTIGEAKTQKIAVMDFVRGGGGLKQFCRFTTTAAFDTSDGSVPGTIETQMGGGSDHASTSATFNNLLTSTANVYLFEGASGAAGLAWYTGTGTIWQIVQMECP